MTADATFCDCSLIANCVFIYHLIHLNIKILDSHHAYNKFASIYSCILACTKGKITLQRCRVETWQSYCSSKVAHNFCQRMTEAADFCDCSLFANCNTNCPTPPSSSLSVTSSQPRLLNGLNHRLAIAVTPRGGGEAWRWGEMKTNPSWKTLILKFPAPMMTLSMVSVRVEYFKDTLVNRCGGFN